MTSLADAAIAVMIPARLHATRLAGKPLARIGDAPMIVHVMRRAMEGGFGGDNKSRLVVACDDAAIAEAVEAAGGEAVMTRKDHPSGSDRIFEALETIDPDGRIRVVLNLQGDLPEIDGGILRPLADDLINTGADIATPFAPATAEEAARPSVVKAAIAFGDAAPEPGPPGPGSVGRVLYFSRAMIPHTRDDGDGQSPSPVFWHHVGIYAWRREALARFTTLPPSPLERAERLEQLRAMEDGMHIAARVIDTAPCGIDTADDLAAARARFAAKAGQ